MSRLAQPTRVLVRPTDRPFSNFDFVEQHFEGSAPIRRLFSQARSRGARTLVIEDVPATSAVADENRELGRLFPDYKMGGLHRLSFWRPQFTARETIGGMTNRDCVGWALLKHDRVTSIGRSQWHVFESMMLPFEHRHCFPTCFHRVQFRVDNGTFSLPGMLYCQQNGLNKSCAQVALRSVCSAVLDEPELTFSRINELAFAPHPPNKPGDGLTSDQIQKVLQGLAIPHFPIFYPKLSGRQKWRSRLPYQKLLYSGIESGAGALLAFSTSGPKAPDCGHIVPLLGHTFNEDAWAARGEAAYFKIGKDIRYIPSSAWMSSFLLHDDNFGSNLCLSRDYIDPKRAEYVVTLFPKGYAAPGFVAEVAACRYFYSLLRHLNDPNNPWLVRLLDTVRHKELILRTVPVTKDEYCKHVGAMRDWKKKREDPATVKDLGRICRPHMWMIEVSVPDLFSTNLRKLGELLLDGGLTISDQPDYTKFVVARFPGRYILFDRLDGRQQPKFVAAYSNIASHTELLSRR